MDGGGGDCAPCGSLLPPAYFMEVTFQRSLNVLRWSLLQFRHIVGLRRVKLSLYAVKELIPFAGMGNAPCNESY